MSGEATVYKPHAEDGSFGSRILEADEFDHMMWKHIKLTPSNKVTDTTPDKGEPASTETVQAKIAAK